MKKILLLIFISLLSFTIGYFIQPFNGDRSDIGITLWQSEARKPGDDLLLVAPIHADFKEDWTKSNVYLMNLEGAVEKKWKIPGIPISNRLGSDGLLYSMLLTPTENKTTTTRGESNRIISTNLNGDITWSVDINNLHHDFDFMNFNKFISIQYERIGRETINRIDPQSDLEIGYSDRLIVFNREGIIEWTWSLKDHLTQIDFATMKFNTKKLPMIDEESFGHINSVVYVPVNPITNNEAVLVSSRRLNTVLMIEYPSGKILWQTPKEELSRQHDATIKDNLVTIFNNNINDGMPMNVQVWDVIKNKKIKDWSVASSYLTSQLMGGARWLSDGSLIISISTSGALLEVDPAGIMSWSFIFNEKKKLKTPVWGIGQNFFRIEAYKDNILKELK
jgi:hypothetical protein